MGMMLEHVTPSKFRSALTRMKSMAQAKRFSKHKILDGLDPVLGRIGPLEVRLITQKRELKAAQKLRYKVFFEEMSARSGALTKRRKLDQDRFDQICDHLIVVDTDAGKKGDKIVGTYRLLRQEVADLNGGFYTQDEYNIDALVARHPTKKFLELGRSCVLPKYRTKRTVELLWHGIWAYTLHHKVDVLFGCASLEGTDTSALSDQLSLLKASNETPTDWVVRAHADRHVEMVANKEFSARKTLAKLPPLIKGYLRIGAYIGEGAVVDHDFGTTDVLVVLPISNINARYITYYGEDAGRHAA